MSDQSHWYDVTTRPKSISHEFVHARLIVTTTPWLSIVIVTRIANKDELAIDATRFLADASGYE
ncbi:MAG: hypothetical protein R3C01_07515 [Planctomycetaceae bacterium]